MSRPPSFTDSWIWESTTFNPNWNCISVGISKLNSKLCTVVWRLLMTCIIAISRAIWTEAQCDSDFQVPLAIIAALWTRELNPCCFYREIQVLIAARGAELYSVVLQHIQCWPFLKEQPCLYLKTIILCCLDRRKKNPPQSEMWFNIIRINEECIIWEKILHFLGSSTVYFQNQCINPPEKHSLEKKRRRRIKQHLLRRYISIYGTSFSW